MEIVFSAHASNMLHERNIQPNTAIDTVCFPDSVQQREDGTVHFFKRIDGKMLHVVFNPDKNMIVTVFFDRRFGHESKN